MRAGEGRRVFPVRPSVHPIGLAASRLGGLGASRSGVRSGGHSRRASKRSRAAVTKQTSQISRSSHLSPYVLPYPGAAIVETGDADLEILPGPLPGEEGIANPLYPPDRRSEGRHPQFGGPGGGEGAGGGRDGAVKGEGGGGDGRRRQEEGGEEEERGGSAPPGGSS